MLKQSFSEVQHGSEKDVRPRTLTVRFKIADKVCHLLASIFALAECC